MEKFLKGLAVVLLSVIILPGFAKAGKLVPTCDNKNCTVNGDGSCTRTCTLKVTGNTGSYNLANVTLDIENLGNGVTIENIVAGSGWELLTGTNPQMSLSASTKVNASDFTLATITLKIASKDVNCSLTVKNTDMGLVVDNPKTGDVLPMAILIGGAGLALIAYVAVRKNTKLFKI